jgi:hypothetical protein
VQKQETDFHEFQTKPERRFIRMKYLSKINRGAILTAVVILGVIGYLITNAILQNNEKPRIKQICDTYIQTEVKYNMLPAAYRIDKPAMSASALTDFLAEMKKNITAFYPDKEQYYQFVVMSLTNDLTSQSKGTGVVYKYEKSIKKYDDMVFDGDIVTVNMTCNTTIEARDLSKTGATVKENLVQEIMDTVILQKIDGQWKVVYATINRPISANGYPDKMGNPGMYK